VARHHEVVAETAAHPLRRCAAAAAAHPGRQARRGADRAHPRGDPPVPPRPAPLAGVGLRRPGPGTNHRGRARPAGQGPLAQPDRPAVPGYQHARPYRDRRCRRPRPVPARSERRGARRQRRRAERLHRGASARRRDRRPLRRLDREPLRPRPARRQRLPDGPAGGAAVVPRPRHGRDPADRVRRPGRPVDPPRPARA
jgi:hypothetical protein